MLAVQGYYDGVAIRTLETFVAKPNQRVIITVMDEFIEPHLAVQRKGLRGILSEYADPALIKKEEGAWARAAVESNGHT